LWCPFGRKPENYEQILLENGINCMHFFLESDLNGGKMDEILKFIRKFLERKKTPCFLKVILFFTPEFCVVILDKQLKKMVLFYEKIKSIFSDLRKENFISPISHKLSISLIRIKKFFKISY
jgi:hypothetical protein